MNLLTIFIVLIVVGVALYLINVYIPMDARIKKILNIAVICIVVFWLLKAAGVLNFLSNVNI